MDFFDEKGALEELYECSLDKLVWGASFDAR